MQVKSRIYRRNLLNRQNGRATTAEGVSKQNLHPFKVMQKRQSCGFLYGFVYLQYAPDAYLGYWFCERCDAAFMLKKKSVTVKDVKA